MNAPHLKRPLQQRKPRLIADAETQREYSKTAGASSRVEIARLRKGEDFVPPDPIRMLADDVTALREQNEANESRIDELHDRIEQFHQSNAQANELIGELTGQIAKLTEQLAADEAATAEATRIKASFASLQRKV